MTAEFELVTAHYIRGRLRLRIKTDMDMRVFFIFLNAALKRVKEIKKAALNQYASSVTLFFDDNVSDVDNLISKLSNQIVFIMSLPNFTNTYYEILNALCFGESDGIEVIIKDDKIATNYLQKRGWDISTDVFKKDTMISKTTFSAGVLTLLLAPALPTPAWLVLLIFGYSSFKQYESTKVIEQLLVQYLSPEKQDTNE
ncbi:MAG: hypothetical protein H7844_08050 [Nitrospirae bacterium YQR-1]